MKIANKEDDLFPPLTARSFPPRLPLQGVTNLPGPGQSRGSSDLVLPESWPRHLAHPRNSRWAQEGCARQRPVRKTCSRYARAGCGGPAEGQQGRGGGALCLRKVTQLHSRVACSWGQGHVVAGLAVQEAAADSCAAVGRVLGQGQGAARSQSCPATTIQGATCDWDLLQALGKTGMNLERGQEKSSVCSSTSASAPRRWQQAGRLKMLAVQRAPPLVLSGRSPARASLPTPRSLRSCRKCRQEVACSSRKAVWPARLGAFLLLNNQVYEGGFRKSRTGLRELAPVPLATSEPRPPTGDSRRLGRGGRTFTSVMM